MGPGLPGFLAAIIGIVVALLIGSAFLRAAVALANKSIGPVALRKGPIGWDWDADEDDEDDEDDDAPRNAAPAIPEPGLGQGMGIVFLTSVAQTAIGILFALVLDLDDVGGRRGELPLWLLAQVCGLALGFVVLLGLLSSMLPTTPKRGALAAFYFYLLILVVGVAIWLLLFILLDR